MTGGSGDTNRLVATRLPEGTRLYAAAGCSASRSRLLNFAKLCADCPPNIDIVSAEEIGLEWHAMEGKEPWGDEYRKNRWAVIYKV